jgi:hypothetical protein
MTNGIDRAYLSWRNNAPIQSQLAWLAKKRNVVHSDKVETNHRSALLRAKRVVAKQLRLNKKSILLV